MKTDPDFPPLPPMCQCTRRSLKPCLRYTSILARTGSRTFRPFIQPRPNPTFPRFAIINTSKYSKELLISPCWPAVTLHEGTRPPALEETDTYPCNEAPQEHWYSLVLLYHSAPLDKSLRIHRGQCLRESTHCHVKSQERVPGGCDATWTKRCGHHQGVYMGHVQ